MADESLGTLIKTSDGKVYFISEEVLAGCEVTDEATAGELKNELEDYGEVTGFSFKPGFEIAFARYQGKRFQLVPDNLLGADVVACW